MGVLNQKHTREYRVGKLVKNVTILGVCTFWKILTGGVFAKEALCISLINHMYRSFPSLSEQVFSSERMLYSTKECFAMRKRVLT